MSYKTSIVAVAAAVLLIIGGVLYANRNAEAISTQGNLNQLYSEWTKTGNENVYWEMCALAVNSDPSAVPNKVIDACSSGL